MSELTQVFFERDLNDSEFGELEALIGSSPEAAMDFTERARNFYLSLGLPEPELPGRLKRWAAGGVGAVALAALWACLGWMGGTVRRPILGIEDGEFKAIAAAGPRSRAAERPAPRAEAKVEPETETGDYLSVVVKRRSAGQVSVRILDLAGRELRSLYLGRLDSGAWDFKWDGKLGTGAAAAPGTYIIEVNEDGKRRSQRVKLSGAP